MSYTLYQKVPPLRNSPFAPDDRDDERVQLVLNRWHALDLVLRPLHRSVEENLRMLCGQQYVAWSPLVGRFLDLAEILGENDELWRHRPVINMLLPAYMLAKARLTENPPIITFSPSTGDEKDAALAEAQDVIFKSKWKEMGMAEVIDRMISILHPCGRAHIVSYIDWSRGPLVPWTAPGRLPVLAPDGSQAVDEYGALLETEVPDVAFDRNGNPLTIAFLDEEGVGYGLPPGAVPHAEAKGQLAADALTPLEARGTHNDSIPWHRKPVHQRRTFMTPEQVYEAWGVEVEPDIRGGDTVARGRGAPDELAQLMLGAGFYGSAGMRAYGLVGGPGSEQDWCTVYEMWETPNGNVPGMARTLESPGGRHTIVAGNKCVKDAARPGNFLYTSPIRCFDFVNVPGRPGGTSPQEMTNGLQRAGNHLAGNILQHADSTSNPVALVHQSTGISLSDWSAEPGGAYLVRTAPQVKPVDYAAPPAIGQDVHRALDWVFAKMREIGHVDGAQGSPQTRDPSGEVIRELRDNADRPTGATARGIVTELGRFAEDLMVWCPMIMDEEEIIRYGGEDEIVRTLTVQKDLFATGKVNVEPDVESMLPESRSERQSRVRRDWMEGVFGPPQSPEARATYLTLARYPNLNRDALPGGRHRVMANHNLGAVLRGTPADSLPIIDVYDNTIHLVVIENYMAGPEFLKLRAEVQVEVQRLRERHQAEFARKQQMMMLQQAEQAAVQTKQLQDAGIDPADTPSEETSDAR